MMAMSLAGIIARIGMIRHCVDGIGYGLYEDWYNLWAGNSERY